MDRRTLLAISLMLLIAVVPAVFLRPDRPAQGPAGSADSVLSQPAETAVAQPEAPRPEIAPQPVAELPAARDSAPGQVVAVESDLYRFEFSTRGARIVSAILENYETFRPGDTGRVQMIPRGSRWLDYYLVLEGDTVSLADWSFEPTTTELAVTGESAELGWVARRGFVAVELTYTFWPGTYMFDVAGRVTGAARSALVVIGLGPRIAPVEADSVWDYRSYGVVTKDGSTERLNFRSLDPGEQRALEGPFEWVAIKSKYFLGAVLALGEEQPKFGGALVTGGNRSGKYAVRADVLASLPAPGGAFSFQCYFGPQDFRSLSAIGHGLEDVNPYGWILRPIIRPFANLIVRILLWMHETLNLGYGWVLILFGLAMRVLLWPLNQKAMRSSMAMQAVQPEMKAVQERYKEDPQRMQQEVMKLYKEHGVNPLGGCLPMLIPMPILFALFFVFRETIEFRGVPFLWLPDLSRPDPFFIIPIAMGLSMFAVTRIGQIGVPPNPQTKMMLYVMPGFLTFIFLKLSAGLNLYYAVSNIASIPQQWLIAQQRLKRQANKKE